MQVPYNDMTPLQAAVGVVQKGLRPGIPPNCPPALGDLLVAAWQQHSAARPSFRDLTPRLQVRRHELFPLLITACTCTLGLALCSLLPCTRTPCSWSDLCPPPCVPCRPCLRQPRMRRAGSRPWQQLQGRRRLWPPVGGGLLAKLRGRS